MIRFSFRGWYQCQGLNNKQSTISHLRDLIHGTLWFVSTKSLNLVFILWLLLHDVLFRSLCGKAMKRSRKTPKLTTLLVNKCWQRTSLNLPHIFKMYSHKLKEGFSFKFSQYKIYSWSSTLSWCQPHLIQERLASSKCCQDFHCLPNMSLFY